MLIGNMAIAPIAYDWQLHLWSYPVFGDLAGVVPPGKRRATLRTLLDGSFQAAYAQQLGARLPVFPGAVRLRNQVEYSLFGVSATPDVVVGTQHELLERAYIEDYCSRDLARFLPGAAVWARHIREMQDAVEHQGKTFVYLLTPSKVAQYPEFLPPGLPCRSSESSRSQLVPAWISLVRAAGVHLVDTTQPVAALHGQFPFKLFPNGGTHWNSVVGAIAGQLLAERLAEARPDAGFAPLRFSWTWNSEPEGVDVDLDRLMNLLWPVAEQPVPEIRFEPAPEATSCPVSSIVMIGGSFGHSPNEYLSRQACHPEVVEFEYWHTVRLAWHDGELGPLSPVHDAERTQALERADIIIYEENEQLLGQSAHGLALYQSLLGPASSQ